MADIELRFDKDMLVLSAPIDAVLARQGIDSARDRQYLNLMEPDVVQDALNLEIVAGAQCIVTTTEDITRARLAHVRMDNDSERLAREALAIANSVTPQHILVEIGPTGLPLDPSSKASLNENRAQYADAARSFGSEGFDAFFLNGFTDIVDMKCALMGVAQVSDKPVFASMSIGAAELEPVMLPDDASADSADAVDQGISHAFELHEFVEVPSFTGARRPRSPLPVERWPEAVAAMEDLGADVIGFETADPIPKAVEYAQ
ncbi:MAG: homocysteine S-methyltransferase family protein, partial [Eggerthellaceae bacterium]|nr:homocysteine S-methyltransferase family protein [Eggerthellaceae bacterium]